MRNELRVLIASLFLAVAVIGVYSTVAGDDHALELVASPATPHVMEQASWSIYRRGYEKNGEIGADLPLAVKGITASVIGEPVGCSIKRVGNVTQVRCPATKSNTAITINGLIYPSSNPFVVLATTHDSIHSQEYRFEQVILGQSHVDIPLLVK